MIKHRKKAPLTDLEVGSFSDIAFLLIIFFILTTQIVRLQGKMINIPAGSESKAEEQKNDKKQMMIHLTTGDKITVNDDGTPVTLENLKNQLLEQNFLARGKPEDRFVILEATPDVHYDLYFKVVMMIDDCGGILAIMEAPEAEKKGS